MTEETEAAGKLAAALAKAQAAFPAIPRDKSVTVQTHSGGSYSFKYAPLDSILAAVREPLSENGLAISQTLDEGALVTWLVHESGAAIQGRLPIPETKNVQAFGSAITYLRRYSIQAILGIAAEEDDDGNTADGNTPTFSDSKPKPPEPDVETEEVTGDVKRSGMVRLGDGQSNKLEARQGPDGYVIGFRLETDRGNIPQVIIAGPAGDALMMATSGNPGAMRDTRATVAGRLYNVKRPGKRSYYRLKVAAWEWGDYRYPPADEDTGPEPPADMALPFEEPKA